MAVVALVATLSVPGQVAHAAEGEIRLRFDTGQQVGLDPTEVRATVQVRVDDCASGCHLYRVGTLRANEHEEHLASWTFAPDGTTRVFTVADTLDRPLSMAYFWVYELRAASPHGYGLLDVESVSPVFEPEGALTYDAGWRRELSLNSTETMIMRSATRGARATYAASDRHRHVGLIAAKGPNNGRVRVQVGASATEVDLYAATWQPRRVVAAVDVPPGVPVTVTNASAAGATRDHVHVDGLVVRVDWDGPAAASTPGAAATPDAQGTPAGAAEAPRESLTVQIVKGQQVARVPAGFDVTLLAQVLGCPDGCTLVQEAADGTRTTLMRTTSPASATLQTLRKRVHLSDYVTYLLYKGTTLVALTDQHEATVAPDSWPLYSWGWSRDSNSTVTDATIMRSSRPGTGATFRVGGTFVGRDVAVVAARGPANGVVAVHVDGVLHETIDLYAPTWKPRVAVTTLDLPLHARVTLVNVTPAARTGKDVHVDSVAIVDAPEDWY